MAILCIACVVNMVAPVVRITAFDLDVFNFKPVESSDAIKAFSTGGTPSAVSVRINMSSPKRSNKTFGDDIW